MYAKGLEDLQVDLEPCASSWIRACYGEGNLHLFLPLRRQNELYYLSVLPQGAEIFLIKNDFDSSCIAEFLDEAAGRSPFLGIPGMQYDLLAVPPA